MLSKRMSDIAPFHVMKLLARAKQLQAAGRDIIHMEVGEPDFQTPDAITQAGIHALETGKTFYTPATGLSALRKAIADYYHNHYGVDIDPNRVIVTPGSSGALQLLMILLINPGDEVLLPDPGYPCNRHFVRLVEGSPLSIPVSSESNYQVTEDVAKKYWGENSKAFLLASPSNPTGSTIPLEEVGKLLKFLDDKQGYLIVDEIYQGLTFDDESQTALKLDSENLFVVNSFSKYFGMTGWRLGWMVIPEAYVEAADRLAQNVYLAPQTMAQYAALEAFSEETLVLLNERRDELKRRRDFLIPALEKLGFKLSQVPNGAFYLYMDCSDVIKGIATDSEQFAIDLLEKTGVAITPGLDFGENEPEQHVRFTFTTSIDRLEEAVKRIADYLKR